MYSGAGVKKQVKYTQGFPAVKKSMSGVVGGGGAGGGGGGLNYIPPAAEQLLKATPPPPTPVSVAFDLSLQCVDCRLLQTLSECVSVCLSVCLPVCLSVCLSRFDGLYLAYYSSDFDQIR